MCCARETRIVEDTYADHLKVLVVERYEDGGDGGDDDVEEEYQPEEMRVVVYVDHGLGRVGEG